MKRLRALVFPVLFMTTQLFAGCGSSSSAASITGPPATIALDWIRQIGTGQDDTVAALGIDNTGSPIMFGTVPGGFFSGGMGGADPFTARFSPSGAIWAHQFGTAADDYMGGGAVGRDGSAVAVGYTTADMFGTNAGEEDVFVRKYAPNGSVEWEKLFGSPNRDFATAAAISNKNGRIAVAGNTTGNLFGPNADTTLTYTDVFVRVYESDGTVAWDNQFGTPQHDTVRALAFDDNGALYVTGQTKGNLFGTSAGGDDCFLRKYNVDGSVAWEKQFGVPGTDVAYGVATDRNGNVYVVGETKGNLFGTNPDSTVFDIFVAKYTSTGTLAWGKQFGKAGDDRAFNVAVNSAGIVFVAGTTTSDLFSTSKGGQDLFLMALSPEGSLIYGRQDGTSQDENYFGGLAVTDSGEVYLAGSTGGAFDGYANQGGSDLFLIRYNASSIR